MTSWRLFGPLHLLVIFVIALFVFGPRKLPELGKGIGEGIRALKEGLREFKQTPSLRLTNRNTRVIDEPSCQLRWGFVDTRERSDCSLNVLCQLVSRALTTHTFLPTIRCYPT